MARSEIIIGARDTMDVYREWSDARHYAQQDANRYQRPMGVEKQNHYGRIVFCVTTIPANPSKRFGWETRVEVVEPDQPGPDRTEFRPWP